MVNTKDEETPISDIYNLIEKVISDQHGKLLKGEFYKGIFCAGGMVFADAQINRWALGNQKISNEVFKDMILASKETWIKPIIRNIESYKIEEVEENIKQELIKKAWKEFGNRIDGKKYTSEQLIVIIIIHKLRNTILPKPSSRKNVKCIGREAEKRKLKKILEYGKKEKQRGFAVVNGPDLIGKTEFVLSYMETEEYLYAYYDYSEPQHNCYSKIVEEITLAEMSFFKDVADGFYPYDGMDKKYLLQQVTTECKQAIIVDNFAGDMAEVNRFSDLIKGSSVDLIIITSKQLLDTENLLRMEPLEPEQIEEIFYLFNPEGREKSIIKEISSKVFGQAWLMRFIGKWYENLRKKNAPEAYQALERLNQGMESNVLEKLEGDMKFRVSSSSSEIKLLGHLHKVAESYLSDFEKTTYLLLSCLGGARMSRDYLIKWLELDENVLDRLCERGWLILDGEENNIYIRIPKVVIMASCNISDRKNSSEYKIIEKFMAKFTREIRYEEYGIIDTQSIKTVIEHLHDFCIESEKYVSAKKYGEVLRCFHFDCIRYYLMMCDAKSAHELRDNWKKKMELTEKTLTSSILDVWEQLFSGDTSALIDLENKYLKPLLDTGIRYNESEKTELKEVIKLILDILWSNVERIEEEGKPGKERYIITGLNMISRYTKLFDIVRKYSDDGKGENLFCITDMRYQMQIRLMQYIYDCHGIIAENWNFEMAELLRIYELTMSKTNLTRLECLEKMRFLLDFQFVYVHYVLSLPEGEIQMKMHELFSDHLRNGVGRCFMENNDILPDDILVKFSIVTNYLAAKKFLFPKE